MILVVGAGREENVVDVCLCVKLLCPVLCVLAI